MYLVAGILALFVGPALLLMGRLGPAWASFFGGFAFISIAGLIGFGILPEALAAGGPPAWAWLGAGLVFPWVIEHLFRRAARQAHLAVLAFGAAGLAVHALADGLALGLAHDAHGGPAAAGPLGLAVVLHRVPVGLAIWYLIAPAFGARIAALTLAAMAAATGIGFWLDERVLGVAAGPALAWFQAFVAGSVLHVVIYEPGHHDRAAALGIDRWPDRLGLLAGLALLYVYLL